MIRTLLLAALAAVAMPAAPAMAGNGAVTRSPDGQQIIVTFTDATDSLLINTTGDLVNGSVILDENAGGTLSTNTGATGCTAVSGNVTCPRVHNAVAAQQLVIEFNGGGDFSEVTQLQLAITLMLHGGEGSDTLWGSERGDVIDGGAGADDLEGFRGDDVLLGGSGDDALEGWQDQDSYTGGAGFDLADMTNTDFNSGVTVTIDDVANDGVSGGAEGDNVHTDVEDVVGTSFDDYLSGSDTGNVLSGLSGNDTLDGRGGGDRFEAGAGNDVVQARDGAPERVLCSDGTDTVTADDVDETAACEVVNRSGVLTAGLTDADGDGATRPADCDDGNPAIRPGAVETPDNGVDEDCNGSDASDRDRDRDGSSRPLDCDDGNAAVRPGANETFGNRVDEDCNGRADPFLQIGSKVQKSFKQSGRITRVPRLGVRNLKAGTIVEVRCAGRGCPLARRRIPVRKATRLLNLNSLVRRARLLAGARLEIRIARPDSIGKIFRFTARARALPISTVLCQTPGSRRTTSC